MGKQTGTVAAVILAVLAVVVIGYMGLHNSVIQADNAVENAMGNLQSAYQRRTDLIPNLVATVQAAAEHETNLQTAVAQLRTAQNTAARAQPGNTDASRQHYDVAQQELGRSIHIVLEAYPQTTATGAFRDLQAQIEGMENRINVARRDYNGVVQSYNNTIETLPTSLFAGGRHHRQSFQATAGAEQAPVVQFRREGQQ